MYGDTQNTGETRSQYSLDISTFRVSYKAMTDNNTVCHRHRRRPLSIILCKFSLENTDAETGGGGSAATLPFAGGGGKRALEV